jgi:hypothetical protein
MIFTLIIPSGLLDEVNKTTRLINESCRFANALFLTVNWVGRTVLSLLDYIILFNLNYY